METEVTSLVQEMLKLGPIGAIFCAGAWFWWQLYNENRGIRKEQLTDARADTEKVLTALNAATEAQKAGTIAMAQLKDVVEKTVIVRGRR